MTPEEYTDEMGYQRKHSDLIHRNRAYWGIYLPNKENFKYPFSYYEVHHKDLNKENNKISNLQIVTPQEHDEIHEEIKRKWRETNRKIEKTENKKEEIKNVKDVENIKSDWIIRYLFTCSKCECHSYDMLREEGKICFGCFNIELNEKESAA